MKMFDYLIVGAGFSGAVLAERLATELNKKVLVIDKRSHLGGNAYDSVTEQGIRIHPYGPHIFHTNSSEVFSYLSKFSGGWRPYEHRVKAEVDGQLIPIPFNFSSLHALCPNGTDAIERDLIVEYGPGASVSVLKMRESKSVSFRRLADLVFEKIFLGYTRKQWGRSPSELDESVLARVPIRIGYDDRYFTDTYQAMPLNGYSWMFNKMLDHPNIEVRLNEKFPEKPWSADHVIWTGPIDEFFGYKHGHLPYRTIEFRHTWHSQDQVQSVGTYNYPSLAEDYTRETEFKHLTGQVCHGTSVCREYSKEHIPGKTEPFYPVPCPESEEIRTRYIEEAKRAAANVTFVGRLADYRYYNMDQAVGRALQVFKRIATQQELPEIQGKLR